MPYLELSEDFRPYYEIHDYTDPWEKKETILCIHGFTESTEAFYAWIPALSRKYRVVLFDIRGFGKTGAVEESFNYSTDLLVDDMVRIINKLAGEAVHVITFKSGGISGMRLAATRPDLVKSLILTCPPMVAPGGDDWLPFMEQHGVRAWARKTMPPRLGEDASNREIDWWVDLMGATSMSTVYAYLRWVSTTEPRLDMPAIKCPALVVLADLSKQTNTAAGQVTPEEVQEGMPHAKVVVLPYDCYHLGGSYPDECSRLTLEFLSSL